MPSLAAFNVAYPRHTTHLVRHPIPGLVCLGGGMQGPTSHRSSERPLANRAASIDRTSLPCANDGWPSQNILSIRRGENCNGSADEFARCLEMPGVSCFSPMESLPWLSLAIKLRDHRSLPTSSEVVWDLVSPLQGTIQNAYSYSFMKRF